MKYWKCSCCGKIKETENNIIRVICGLCQIELTPYPEYKFEGRVEVKIKYGGKK